MWIFGNLGGRSPGTKWREDLPDDTTHLALMGPYSFIGYISCSTSRLPKKLKKGDCLIAEVKGVSMATRAHKPVVIFEVTKVEYFSPITAAFNAELDDKVLDAGNGE